MPRFFFELVSPQKVVFVGNIDQLDVPGADGDFGVLAATRRYFTSAPALLPYIVMVSEPGLSCTAGYRGRAAGATVLAEFAAPVMKWTLAYWPARSKISKKRGGYAGRCRADSCRRTT